MKHQWPEHFTEVRSLIPDAGDVLACVGAANTRQAAELWRYNGEWSLEHGWAHQSRVLDAVRFNDALYTALGSNGAQLARDGAIVREWPGWRMVKRLIVDNGELWAFLMLRRGSDASPVWRTSDGETWREHPFDAPAGIYQACVFRDEIHVGTLGPPVHLATLDGTVIRTFDAAEIESFTPDGDGLIFTVGTRPRQKAVPPVWRLDCAAATALPGAPLAWRFANNFNACCMHDGALHVSAAGRFAWPSVWQREGGRWRRMARWPSRRGQWVYDMISRDGSLLAAFAGRLGAAEIVEANGGTQS